MKYFDSLDKILLHILNYMSLHFFFFLIYIIIIFNIYFFNIWFE